MTPQPEQQPAETVDAFVVETDKCEFGESTREFAARMLGEAPARNSKRLLKSCKNSNN